MKRYHVFARSEDNDRTVGYFIGDTQKLVDPSDLKKNNTLNWIKVTPDELKGLVASDQVQMLTMRGNEVVCKYTREELKMLAQGGIGKSHVRLLEQYYWLYMDTFSSDHIKYAEEGRALACSVGALGKFFSAYYVPVTIYGTKKSIESVLLKKDKLVASNCPISQVSVNKCLVLLHLVMKEPPNISHYIELPLLYNKTVLENVADNAKSKVRPFTTSVSNFDTEPLLNFFRTETRLNLMRIADSSSESSPSNFAEATSLFG